ncbi:MAG: hypothetical protein ACR2MO_06910, partial [Acidimicrobiales bacterium]
PPPSPSRPPAPPLPGRRPPPPPPARAEESPASAPAQAPPAEAQAPPAGPPPATTAPAGALPTRDALTKAWGDSVLSSLSSRAKARFGAGRFCAVEAGAAVFALPNAHYLGRCQEVRPEVEAALAASFGVPVPLRLVVEAPDAAGALSAPADDEGSPGHDMADLQDMQDMRDAGPSDQPPPAVTSPEERVMRAFPGAEEVST